MHFFGFEPYFKKRNILQRAVRVLINKVQPHCFAVRKQNGYRILFKLLRYFKIIAVFAVVKIGSSL